MRLSVIVFLCLVLIGCTTVNLFGGEDYGHVPTGPERWAAENQDTYNYEIVPWCHECEETFAQKRVRVFVEKNIVVRAMHLDPPNEGKEVERLDYYQTIDQLLSDIQRVLLRTPDYIEVSYEAQYGYPEKYSVDISRETTDDEFGYEISNYKKGK